MEKPLAPAAYQSLAELRYQIRRFLYFSEQAARDAGLEPQQHQLMLALKGLPKGARPRIAELAERMQIQPATSIILRPLRQPARLSATLVWPSLHSSGWYWFLFWRRALA